MFALFHINKLSAFSVLLSGILLWLNISAVNAGQHDSVLVDTAWLLQHQHDVNFLIVDARSADDYKKGHIAGAVNIPVADTFNPVVNTDRVGNIKYIAALFSRVGVRNDHTIVVYDDNTYIDAGRVFWVFEVYGHKNVKLLNGGFDGWKKFSEQALSQKMTRLKPSKYIPEIDPQHFITKFSMRLAIEDKQKLIVDTRSKEDFEGKKSIASRAGHIPNAINIPWTENFHKVDGILMLKPISELKKIYDPLAEGKRVILYCNKGKQSSFSYTILRQIGHEAAHYDGSWFEWGNDESLPIEK